MRGNAVSIVATGATTTTTASTATAAAAIPKTSNGTTMPKYVRFCANGVCHVRLAPSAGLAVAVTTDPMVQPGDALILQVHGNTHWSAIDQGSPVKVNITPLEDA